MALFNILPKRCTGVLQSYSVITVNKPLIVIHPAPVECARYVQGLRLHLRYCYPVAFFHHIGISRAYVHT